MAAWKVVIPWFASAECSGWAYGCGGLQKALMKMLKAYYLRQQFMPDGLGWLFNPFFLIRKDLLVTFKKLIPQISGDVLDYGCGRKPYQGLFSVSSYTGADIENPGHSHAQEDIDILFDGKHLPVEANRFDAVFSSEVFEHVFEPDSTLQEVHRVLKPGGLFLLSIPFVWNEHEVPYDYARYTAFGFPYLLEKHGFEVLELHRSGNFVRVLAQLRALYLYRRMENWPVGIRMICSMLLISPIILLGVLADAILPKDTTLFFNTVILARKK